MTTTRVPCLDLKPAEDRVAVDAAIRRVVDRGWFVLGPEVDAFETAFARATRAGHAIGVGTGTDALAIILRGLGIGAGDEIITTPISAAYTALACIMVGARPVFTDIDPSRLTLNPDRIAAAITPATRAIIPVHLYGQPADMADICAVAKEHGLMVIEDCCQSHLASCGGKPVGSFGVAAAYSFYPTKNLGALGDGGAITTNDADLAARVKRIRNGGQTDRYHHGEMGVNSRLDEIQAAVLSARLPLLAGWTATRRTKAARYRQLLHGVDTIQVPPECDPGHVYHLFPILCPHRAKLQAFLADEGIETLIHYPVPIPRQPAVQSEHPTQCPVADRVCAQVLSLPLYPSMPDEHIEIVAEAVRRFVP
jgi:dTDP-4-amino-4,6-dideoxygalactose transaminase